MQTPSANCVHDRAISWESLLEETKYTRAHAKESASRRPKDLTSVKAGSVLRNEAAITASWGRLIDNIETEARVIAEAGADIVPSIEFKDIRDFLKSQPFLVELRTRGAAVIRNVISEDETKTWKRELDDYVANNLWVSPSNRDEKKPESHDLFWSPAQLSSRAHPNVLAAQKFAMTAYRGKSQDPHRFKSSPSERKTSLESRVSTNFPIAYADRLRTVGSEPDMFDDAKPLRSINRDEGAYAGWPGSTGYHSSRTGFKRKRSYQDILSGKWEEHDPWDITERLDHLIKADGDNTHPNDSSDSTVFCMFQGMLALTGEDEVIATTGDNTAPIRICPLPLKLMTAYRLLQPFFSSSPSSEPSSPTPTTTDSSDSPGNLDSDSSIDTPSDWTPSAGDFDSHSSKHKQAGSNHHIHFGLHNDDRKLDIDLLEDVSVSISSILSPGDYLVWHPDALVSPGCSSSSSISDTSALSQQRPIRCYDPQISGPLFLSVPVCPLTQANAVFLERQRRAFLLGFPGPKFTSEYVEDDAGESRYLGRPGVQEVHDVGGEEALRAMGLLAWDEEASTSKSERQLLRLTNSILFPDAFHGKTR